MAAQNESVLAVRGGGYVSGSGVCVACCAHCASVHSHVPAESDLHECLLSHGGDDGGDCGADASGLCVM